MDTDTCNLDDSEEACNLNFAPQLLIKNVLKKYLGNMCEVHEDNLDAMTLSFYLLSA